MMLAEHSPLWERFLERARVKLSNQVLKTWFAPIRCRDFNNDTLVLEVRDQFTRDWLNDHYSKYISEQLKELHGEFVAIEWIVNPELALTVVPDSEGSAAESAAEEKRSAELVSRPGLFSANPRYTFDTFVAGPSNQFALAAARAVADHPASGYNPLFLFGGVGLGKTHLLCAVGNQILRENNSARIIYTSSEQFMNEVINAVRFSKLDQFHHKYRRECEVLLIDDIQLIAGKDRTQHEFFHIFNTMHDSMRQIIITSDKLPHEIPDIEERLRSRFQWGLIADIQPPEIETRIAILHKKAESEGFELSSEIALFLAQNIRSNVRELEGALVRLIAHASLTRNGVNVDYARQVLGDILVAKPHTTSVESIQKTVAGYFHVKIADLKSPRRLANLVRPRQVAMYLCRKHGGASYPVLGTRFGNKDHTTVMSACRKIETLLKTDPELRSQVMEIERQLDVR